MKSSCLDMMVFINPLNPVLWNFPRLKLNTHPPAWLSSQQYPHHTQPVCDIWGGRLSQYRTMSAQALSNQVFFTLVLLYSNFHWLIQQLDCLVSCKKRDLLPTKVSCLLF